MLTDVVVLAAVLVALGNCSPCANKDDIKLYDKNNPSNPVCWPFPKCNDGQESSVEPGSSHPHGTNIACINCHEGYFSNNHTSKRCHRCTSCGNNKELSPCESSRDRQCSHSCISSKFYFNSTDQQCYLCTECCGARDEDIELQCVSSRVGTVVGGNGEKHCKASFKSSQQCSNELPLKKNVSSPACTNSSVTNSSTFEATECSCGSSFSVDGLYIALICVLGLAVVIGFLFGYRWYVSRRQSSRSSYTGMPPCIPNYTDCHEKLKLIPEGMKINNIEPYQVEVILTDSLDINESCVKNWRDVGRMLGIADSELQIVKQEYYREGGSPTKCLLRKLSTLGNVVSLRTFVETTHKLNRHDICKAVYEVYKSQETAV